MREKVNESSIGEMKKTGSGYQSVCGGYNAIS